MSEQIPCHELVQRSSSSPPPAIAVASQHLQTTPKDEKIFEYSVQKKKKKKRKTDQNHEYKLVKHQTDAEEKILTLLSKKRNCPSFYYNR